MKPNKRGPVPMRRTQGAALIEMNWVLWLALLPLTMVLIHNGMLFFARNQLNHATFMAARAGAVNGASKDAMRKALEEALVPMYGGGLNDGELQASLDRAKAAVSLTELILKDKIGPGERAVTMLNPTTASFDDWADTNLSVGGIRVIPNTGLEYRGTAVKPASKQNIQDANILRIRVVLAYRPKVPLVMGMYKAVLAWQRSVSPGDVDPIFAAMVDSGDDAPGFGGYIPIVSYATLQMQSDAREN